MENIFPKFSGYYITKTVFCNNSHPAPFYGNFIP